VPKITVIMRKAYGGAYLAMCSARHGRRLGLSPGPPPRSPSWAPRARSKFSSKREIAAAENKKGREAELAAEYREKFASPYQAAAKAMITDIIEPSQTRSIVAMALRNTLSKRETRPPKKHGNIPL
jgi:propionyl-CoA carboxylase beta chain